MKAEQDLNAGNVIVKVMRFTPATRVESPDRLTPTTLTMGVAHPVGVDLSGGLGSSWIRAVRGQDFIDNAYWTGDAKFRRVSPTYTTVRVRLNEGLCGRHEGGSCYPKGSWRVSEVRLALAWDCEQNPGGGCVSTVVAAIPKAFYRHVWATKTQTSAVTRRSGKLRVTGTAKRAQYTNKTDKSGNTIGGYWQGWKKARVSVWFDPKGSVPARRVKGVKVKRGGRFAFKVAARKDGRYQLRQASQGTYDQSASRSF